MFRILPVIFCILFFAFPVSAEEATSSGGAAREITLDQSDMEDAQIVAWAQNAACKSLTLDYKNYEEQLRNAAGFFTAEGYKIFRETLDKSRMLKDMIQQQHIMTAMPYGDGHTVQKSLNDGRFQWDVDIPVRLTIRAGDQAVHARTRLKLIVVRVPVTENQSGIAISSFAAN